MHETQYLSYSYEELPSPIKIMLKIKLWSQYAITIEYILKHVHQHIS